MREPQKLTLAFVTTEYPTARLSAGIGSYTQALGQALSRRGHKIYVISRSAAEDRVEDDGGVTVYHLGPARFNIPKRMNALSVVNIAGTSMTGEWRYRRKVAGKLDRLISGCGVDLVEGADSGAESLFYRPEKHPGVPFVVRLHGATAVCELFDKNIPEAARRAVRGVERRLCAKATHLSAPTRAAEPLLRREMGLGQRRIAIFPNPPSLKLLAAGHEEVDPNLILYVGRLTLGKGVELLARAFVRVLQQRPEARLLLVGTDCPIGAGWDKRSSSTKDYLLSILAPCRERVVFTGHLPHTALGGYYRRAAVCVFPSYFESFGYTCLEAMAHGKAVVTSRSAGTAELLDDGRCGLLFSPPDVGELAERMVTLLQDPALRHSLGESARKRALKHYNEDSVIEQTLAFYRRAISERRRGR